MRTQGLEEPVRTFVTSLEALTLHMEPAPTLALQLDMLQRNMKLQLQQLVRRGEFEDIGTFSRFSYRSRVMA